MSALHYPFDRAIPEAREPLEVARGIKWVRMPLPFALDHVNLWLVSENAGWCAVDTGLSWEPCRKIWQKLLDTHRLTRLIVTHYHPDHFGLAGWLQQEQGIDLWMTQSGYFTAQAVSEGTGGYAVDATAELFRRHGLGENDLNKIKQQGNSYRAGISHIPSMFKSLADNQIIRIGPHSWQVIAGHGHAVEHASLYCETQRVLISGDMLLPSISTNIPVVASDPLGNPLQQYLDSLQRFRELPEDTLVLPCHGRPFIGARSRVDAIEAHHRQRCCMILNVLSEPKTAGDIMPGLFDWGDMDAHQLFFAMGETIAHLNYLCENGHLRRIEDEEQNLAFELL